MTLEREKRNLARYADGLRRRPYKYVGTPLQEAASQLKLSTPSIKEIESLNRKRVGRPVAGKFQVAQDFAVLVLFFEFHGSKQASKAALSAWQRGLTCTVKHPTRRLIQKALKVVRQWPISEITLGSRPHDAVPNGIHLAAQFVRLKYGLKPLQLNGKNLIN